ncbi:DUF547 domain-containing protein [Candidatus Moduliflexota bacterium]
MVRKAVIAAAAGAGLLLSVAVALAAPKPDLWDRWVAHDPSSPEIVDHSAWDRFLDSYVVADHPSGINLLRYGEAREGKAALDGYVTALEVTAVSKYGRAEQMAYWINLYNAVTVQVVLDHYPVGSIREIKISPGLFSSGPWDKKLLKIEGQAVSLNDIEHRILRPIWKDNRVHYAVNCASLGCPDLQPVAFTAANTEELLEKAARAYVNHPRGARFEDGKLVVSSIYDWFEIDFGGSAGDVIDHLRSYAEGDLSKGLEGYSGKFKSGYDWDLNDLR